MCVCVCVCVCAKVSIPIMLKLRGSTFLHPTTAANHWFGVRQRGSFVCVCVCVCVCVPRYQFQSCSSCEVQHSYILPLLQTIGSVFGPAWGQPWRAMDLHMYRALPTYHSSWPCHPATVQKVCPTSPHRRSPCIFVKAGEGGFKSLSQMLTLRPASIGHARAMNTPAHWLSTEPYPADHGVCEIRNSRRRLTGEGEEGREITAQ